MLVCNFPMNYAILFLSLAFTYYTTFASSTLFFLVNELMRFLNLHSKSLSVRSFDLTFHNFPDRSHVEAEKLEEK